MCTQKTHISQLFSNTTEMIYQLHVHIKGYVSAGSTHTNTQTTVLRLSAFCSGRSKRAGTRQTFTHSQLLWSSIIPYLLPPSTTIHDILPVQSTHLTVFFPQSLSKCDPIRHVSSRSSETCLWTAIPGYFTSLYSISQSVQQISQHILQVQRTMITNHNITHSHTSIKFLTTKTQR